jgi:hypothetical protein
MATTESAWIEVCELTRLICASMEFGLILFSFDK